MAGIKDEMETGDKDAELLLKCAKCGSTVLPNQPHQCQEQKEKQDENEKD